MTTKCIIKTTILEFILAGCVFASNTNQQITKIYDEMEMLRGKEEAACVIAGGEPKYDYEKDPVGCNKYWAKYHWGSESYMIKYTVSPIQDLLTRWLSWIEQGKNLENNKEVTLALSDISHLIHRLGKVCGGVAAGVDLPQKIQSDVEYKLSRIQKEDSYHSSNTQIPVKQDIQGVQTSLKLLLEVVDALDARVKELNPESKDKLTQYSRATDRSNYTAPIIMELQSKVEKAHQIQKPE